MMLLKDAVALLDSVDAFSDTIQIREAWQTVKVELAQQSTNNQSNQCHEDIEKYYKDES